jgi:hypothetical protein
MMLVLLQRNIGGLGGHGIVIWRLVAKATGASVAMGAVVHLVVIGLAQVVPVGSIGEILLVGGGGLVGTAVYGALAVLLRIEEVGLLRLALRDWGQRLTGMVR